MNVLTTIATMKMDVANVPTAIYALCKPTDPPFEMIELKLDSPKGRAWDVSAATAATSTSTSDNTSFVFTTPSTINSSEIYAYTHRTRMENSFI